VPGESVQSGCAVGCSAGFCIAGVIPYAHTISPLRGSV
jgi:hypothetical protein